MLLIRSCSSESKIGSDEQHSEDEHSEDELSFDWWKLAKKLKMLIRIENRF
jgi:hypothetical protein